MDYIMLVTMNRTYLDEGVDDLGSIVTKIQALRQLVNGFQSSPGLNGEKRRQITDRELKTYQYVLFMSTKHGYNSPGTEQRLIWHYTVYITMVLEWNRNRMECMQLSLKWERLFHKIQPDSTLLRLTFSRRKVWWMSRTPSQLEGQGDGDSHPDWPHTSQELVSSAREMDHQQNYMYTLASAYTSSHKMKQQQIKVRNFFDYSYAFCK